LSFAGCSRKGTRTNIVKNGDGLMNKKWISAAMALVITLGISFTTVYADPASDLAAVKTKQSELDTKISKIDNDIETIMSKIDANKKEITQKQADIKQAKADIAKQEAAIKAEQDLYNKRMRAMYMSGPANYIEVLLSSKNLSQFISLVGNCQTIMEYDSKLIGEFKAHQAELTANKNELEKDNQTLVSLKNENETKLTDLKKQKADQAPLLADLKALETKYSAQLLASKNVPAAGLVALSQASTSVSRGSTGVSASEIISYASNFLGVPYVWGGTSPSGFDCSGLVQYTYGHFGINLPRTAAEQQNVGTYITRENLQPGDLVFFGDPAHHVGIYVGNGMMLHAPHTGDVVRVGPLSSDFVNGRRVL
jgi:peptidoglycan DL-endopeptidase CwlO